MPRQVGAGGRIPSWPRRPMRRFSTMVPVHALDGFAQRDDDVAPTATPVADAAGDVAATVGALVSIGLGGR